MSSWRFTLRSFEVPGRVGEAFIVRCMVTVHGYQYAHEAYTKEAGAKLGWPGFDAVDVEELESFVLEPTPIARHEVVVEKPKRSRRRRVGRLVGAERGSVRP